MSDRVTLRTGKSIGDFLDAVIGESLKSTLQQKALQEKEKQVAVGGQGGAGNSGGNGGGDTDLSALMGSGDDGGDSEEAPPSKTVDDEDEKLKQGDIEPKDIIDRLNAIRSGKSFKDDKVKAAMEEYVSSLSKAEKIALLTFAKGIAQIVTGEVPGQQAAEPVDHPSDISMEKKHGKVKHVQPNVIKGSPVKPKGKGSENTSAPVPITPKK